MPAITSPPRGPRQAAVTWPARRARALDPVGNFERVISIVWFQTSADSQRQLIDLGIVAGAKAAFRASPMIDPHRMFVSAQDGYVSLSGAVDGEEGRQLAQEMVERIPGVTGILRIELYFDGDGTVRQIGEGAFSGGVLPPTLGEVECVLHHTVADEEGLLNPELGEASVEGTFQLNLAGTAHGFHELGRYFLALAELNSSADPDHHQHFDGVRSSDGRTVVDIIVRKGGAGAG